MPETGNNSIILYKFFYSSTHNESKLLIEFPASKYQSKALYGRLIDSCFINFVLCVGLLIVPKCENSLFKFCLFKLVFLQNYKMYLFQQTGDRKVSPFGKLLRLEHYQSRCCTRNLVVQKRQIFTLCRHISNFKLVFLQNHRLDFFVQNLNLPHLTCFRLLQVKILFFKSLLMKT